MLNGESKFSCTGRRLGPPLIVLMAEQTLSYNAGTAAVYSTERCLGLHASNLIFTSQKVLRPLAPFQLYCPQSVWKILLLIAGIVVP